MIPFSITIEGHEHNAFDIMKQHGLTRADIRHIEELSKFTGGITFNLINWYAETSNRQVMNTF